MSKASESRSQLTLDAAMQMMVPLMALLLREGVTYPMLSHALKNEFLNAAPQILEESASKTTDSSLSTLTGVNRKDVRAWRLHGRSQPQSKTLGRAMEVFTHWVGDRRYLDKRGRPRALPRMGADGSFEALANEVSIDVHPRTLLQELVRLGVAEIDNPEDTLNSQTVSLVNSAFVPKDGMAEMLQMMSANVGDHIRTAVGNVSGKRASLLEQSIFSEPLSPRSIEALAATARTTWAQAFQKITARARELELTDAKNPCANQRFRVGMYIYHGDSEST